MQTTTQTAVRELDRRINDGFDVRLLWEPETNCVFVTVDHQRSGDALTLAVDPADALEAFHHPFAYAGKDYDSLPERSDRLPAGQGPGEDER
jgi:hypothetical protein